MNQSELAHWLRLMLTPGVGNGTARILLTRFGLPEAIFHQPASVLRDAVGQTLALSLTQPPKGLDTQVQATWDWLHGATASGVAKAVLTLADPRYPPSLLATEDPPVLLYVHGATRWLTATTDSGGALGLDQCLAIVGSRNPTPQGATNARQFATALAQTGLTVVSGLALGVDGAAHEGALEATPADAVRPVTVAVVGTGLDRVYPKRHLELARRIAEHGLIFSEYPIGTPPIATNFPRRNRIISGLAHGTLVVEAALQSGSLITARLAAEQGREVFAIPGSIHSPQSRGCHALIRQGAKLVECAQDVLEELPFRTGMPRAQPSVVPTPTTAAAQSPSRVPSQSTDPSLDGIDATLIPALGFDPVSLDALQARTGLDTARLQAQLMALELAGMVARLPGGRFQRLAST
jgi:DNA processing protein